MGTNFMVGTISYLPGNSEKTDARIGYHENQLRWLEGIGIDFPYYRVESDWCDKARETLTTSLDLHSIQEPQHYPGYNRNLLLDVLYKSNFDWLVCLDDDRDLYPLYDGDSFFRDLGTKPVVNLAKQGYLITCLSPVVEPFKKVNYEWQHKNTHWYITKEASFGFLQICFIPNLVKFGYKPVWFDGDTPCLKGDVPEDTKFQYDWLLAKHGMLKNRNLIVREGGNGKNSSVFRDEDHRKECHESHAEWAVDYLIKRSPRNPELQTKSGLSKRRNPPFTGMIPRSVPFEFTEKELPKGVVKE